VQFGNAGRLQTNGTGWFVGFSDWTKSPGSNLRHVPMEQPATGLCVKWFMHEAGDPNGGAKPVSEGRTLSLVAGAPGEFKLEFSESPAFAPADTVSCLLREPGDYALWGAGVFHRWSVLKPTCILTLRWSLPP
jgi:hypothetical protein